MLAAVVGAKQKRDVATYRKGPLIVIQWTDKRTLTTLSTKHTNKIFAVPSWYMYVNNETKHVKWRVRGEKHRVSSVCIHAHSPDMIAYNFT